MDYYNLLKQLQFEIESNPLLNVEQSDMRHGLAEKALESLTRRYNIQATDDLMNFYKTVANFQIIWRLKKDDISHNTVFPTQPMGIINILAIDEYIGHDESYRVQMENNDVLYYFDYYNSDSQEGVCLMAKDGIIQQNLFLYGLEIGLVDTGLQIPQYIQLLIKNKGFAFWQRSLIDSKGQFATQLNFYLPQLFQSNEH